MTDARGEGLRAVPDTGSCTKQAADLRPLHGILSTHGRRKAETWSCLVCSASQPLVNEACSICNRDRIPPWLVDVHGCAVLPGSIVRCPRASARYCLPPPPPAGLHSGVLDATGRSPNKGRSLMPQSQSPSNTPRAGASSGTNPPVSPEQSGGTIGRRRGTTTPSSSPLPTGRSSRRAFGAEAMNGVASPAGKAVKKSPRNKAVAAGAPQQQQQQQQQQHTPVSSPKQNRTNNKNGKSHPGGRLVSSPQRGVKGRAEAAFEAATAAMKSKFEGLPGDCTFMVVAVNGMRSQPPRTPRSLEGYCVVEGEDGHPSSRALVKVVIGMAKSTSVEVVDPSLEGDEREKFLEFGLCGRCERTYRIEQGWKHVLHKETVSECEEKVAKLTELAAETEERKKILRAGRGPRTEILEASERLRSIYAELATTRRRLEPLVTSCPFCLWSSEPLFIAETGARQMGEPKQ